MYDVASALPYRHVDPRKLKMAMSIGGEYRLDIIGRRHWVWFAEQLGLDAEAALTRMRDQAERLPDAFARVVADVRAEHLDTELPGRLLDAVAGRVADCRRVLALRTET